MEKPELKLVVSQEKIHDRVSALAAELSARYTGRELVLVGALNGVFIFLADLVRKMTIPVSIDFIRVASYGTGDTSSGRIHMTKDVETKLTGRPVVIVEDIADSGLTLDWLRRHMIELGAASVETCVLINKLERRDVPVELEYVGFEVQTGFLVGYGLDYDGRYRYLPAIFHLVLT